MAATTATPRTHTAAATRAPAQASQLVFGQSKIASAAPPLCSRGAIALKERVYHRLKRRHGVLDELVRL
jgi:hypothetical protein